MGEPLKNFRCPHLCLDHGVVRVAPHHHGSQTAKPGSPQAGAVTCTPSTPTEAVTERADRLLEAGAWLLLSCRVAADAFATDAGIAARALPRARIPLRGSTDAPTPSSRPCRPALAPPKNAPGRSWTELGLLHQRLGRTSEADRGDSDVEAFCMKRVLTDAGDDEVLASHGGREMAPCGSDDSWRQGTCSPLKACSGARCARLHR